MMMMMYCHCCDVCLMQLHPHRVLSLPNYKKIRNSKSLSTHVVSLSLICSTMIDVLFTLCLCDDGLKQTNTWFLI